MDNAFINIGDEYGKENMKSKVKEISNTLGRSGRWTIILLLIILLGSLFASLIQNDFGNVEITAHKFDTRDDQVVAYDLYRPDGVDTENKAPLIIVVAGFQRSPRENSRACRP